MWVYALVVLSIPSQPAPEVSQAECERELSTREVGYQKCLRAVADDTRYSRCLKALKRRRFLMREEIDAPLSDQEKEERRRIPAHLVSRTPQELEAGIQEDARSADAYLETAEKSLGAARGLGIVDLLGIEADAGAGGPKVDVINAMLNDIMQADRFLLALHWQQELLRHSGGTSEALSVSARDPDFATFDWVLDNPLADFFTLAGLSELRTEIAKSRAALARILGPASTD